MFYLSEVTNKKIVYQNRIVGKLLDLVVSEENAPHVYKALIKKNKKKYLLPLTHIEFRQNVWHIVKKDIEFAPYDDKLFYLAEDLLDKQVIDVNGRRLVRVNDVLIKQNGEYAIDGIDIGSSGIFRRLGLGNPFGLKNITLPWSYIEAFDYQTGDVKIKVSQNKLSTFHPAEIADILEEAGTKERLGIVESLDAKKAAAAIEEADEETQSAILEQVGQSTLKGIINRMHLSEIADVIHDLNPFTENQILATLGIEKAKRLKKLLIFEDDEAGGLMDLSFLSFDGGETVQDVLTFLGHENIKPETIIIVDSEKKLRGTVNLKNIITLPPLTLLTDTPMHAHFVYENESFSSIFQLFVEYNLRTLPVIAPDRTVIGLIKIDIVLSHIQQEETRDNAI